MKGRQRRIKKADAMGTEINDTESDCGQASRRAGSSRRRWMTGCQARTLSDVCLLG